VSSTVISDPAPVSDLRTRILDAAVHHFAARGYAATSVRMVVQSVGCTKPALYYHFGSKEELFLESVQTHTDRFLTLVDDVLSRPGSVRDRLAMLCTDIFAAVASDPTPMRLLMTAEHRPDAGQPKVDLLSLHREFVRRLERVVVEGVARGEVRNDVPAADLTLSLIAQINIRSMGLLYGLPLREDVVDVLIDIFFHGAAPPERQP
jgi:AcrR family transcriptional regulator